MVFSIVVLWEFQNKEIMSREIHFKGKGEKMAVLYFKGMDANLKGHNLFYSYSAFFPQDQPTYEVEKRRKNRWYRSSET